MADDIFQYISLSENFYISNKISLKYVAYGVIDWQYGSIDWDTGGVFYQTICVIDAVWYDNYFSLINAK